MTQEQRSVRDWMVAFGQETPNKPCIPSLEVRKLRAKLILEEALETILALGFEIDFNYKCDEEWDEVAPNLKEIADGCEDLKVVTEGTLVACGLLHQQDIKETSLFNKHNDPLFDEVMRSNWSKMWTYQEVANLPDYHSEVCLEVNPHPQSERSHRGWLVKDKEGKVIKSPSYSLANLQPIIDVL